jgi:hypothetical protein
VSSLTFEEAYDEIMALFQEGWDDNTDGLKVYYEDVEDQQPVDQKAFCKVRINFGESRQRGFGGGQGGERLYTRHGDFRCQIYTLAGKGLLESLDLVKVVVDSFEGKHSPGGVWFHSVNTVDIGRNGVFRVHDVAVTFSYDERK